MPARQAAAVSYHGYDGRHGGRPALDPGIDAFAEIAGRHQRGELLALDLQPFGDAPCSVRG